mmetsp:Transcript_18506/g.26137  ORF Transcript_18506/g.26137 Transcript_18506/m.26137 type:complete len:222 (-) Transcript_18506:342-1007(-)
MSDPNADATANASQMTNPDAATDDNVMDASTHTDSGNELLDDDTKARKRKERLEQNRISARESRKRKKTMIEELQRTVITLSRENKDLNERNESLRRQLMEIGTKYPNVVPLHAIMGGPPPTNPPGGLPTGAETPQAAGGPSAAPPTAGGPGVVPPPGAPAGMQMGFTPQAAAAAQMYNPAAAMQQQAGWPGQQGAAPQAAYPGMQQQAPPAGAPADGGAK